MLPAIPLFKFLRPRIDCGSRGSVADATVADATVAEALTKHSTMLSLYASNTSLLLLVNAVLWKHRAG